MKKSIPGRSGLSFPTFAVKGEQMWCRLVGWVVRLWRWLRPARCYGRRKVVESEKPKRGWNHPKPPWVAKELVRLKAMDEHLTCRTAAAVFNRIHGHKGVTVQRTYVSNTLRKHLYEIMLKRREVRRRRPGAGSQLRIMGLDLTGKTDESGKLHYILGALDHGSRACQPAVTAACRAGMHSRDMTAGLCGICAIVAGNAILNTFLAPRSGTFGFGWRESTRIFHRQRIAVYIHITVIGLTISWIRNSRIGADHPAQDRVIHQAVHVYGRSFSVHFAVSKTSRSHSELYRSNLKLHGSCYRAH